MMLAIDTCSWFKIHMLERELNISIVSTLLNRFKLFFTHELLTEFRKFFPNYLWIVEYCAVLPKRNIVFSSFLKEGFDEADASLLEYASEKEYFVVSEDPKMLRYVRLGFQLLQLADLIAVLYKKKFLSKQVTKRIIKFLRTKRNITKKKHKDLKLMLQI